MASLAGQGRAMLVNLALVAAVVFVCLSLVRLMPTAAPAEQR
ncbi:MULTISPECIES: hypothetical protein [Hyphomicrobiales]|uniref:Uncharacterized protein n=1 Tax=Rhodopseudomonas julia TaxID=200617 RepID=A0ABU0C140_9BRAD|nr:MULTISPECIES: hypothetical protein [Hyphomicrobiales]MDQ0324241.1 hypothetical protein [Rhodopseudomonas julia]